MQIRHSAVLALVFAAVACGQTTATPKTPGAVASPASSGAEALLLPERIGTQLVTEVLSVVAPLRIDKTTVSAGVTLTGTLTYQNISASSVTLGQVAIAARPPGGTHSGGALCGPATLSRQPHAAPRCKPHRDGFTDLHGIGSNRAMGDLLDLPGLSRRVPRWPQPLLYRGISGASGIGAAAHRQVHGLAGGDPHRHGDLSEYLDQLDDPPPGCNRR